MTSTSYDVLVLAGGRSRRMGGGDKTRLPVGDVSLLDRVLAAPSPDAGVVVVGDERPTARPVIWVREEPVHAGPAAAVAAGLPHLARDITVLLAADLPLLTTAFVDGLVAATASDAGAVPIDRNGLAQWLCSAWPTAMLRAVDWSSASSLRDGLGALAFARLAVDTDAASPWLDCDTPEDLRRAREHA